MHVRQTSRLLLKDALLETGIDFLSDFTLALASCNKQEKPNLIWDDVLDTQPDVWVWGGDNIYTDTNNMQRLRAMYEAQNHVKGYQQLKNKAVVIGTWDDNDFGLNDGPVEFESKKQSQQEFLSFMGIPEDSPKRKQEGVYASHDYDMPEGIIKIIVLETHYFRTALTPDTKTKKRTKPNSYGEGTILGNDQWQWLSDELNSSKADFNIIVSSIQVLSNEHGFETWGNFPHEVDKLKKVITDSGAESVIILSGDRHISEFSKTEVVGLSYPLIDFTSSGLTHAYSDYKGEPNPYRIGDVIFTESFGLLRFNLKSRQVRFTMLGDGNELLGELKQTY